MLEEFYHDGPADNSVIVGPGGVLYGTTTLYQNVKAIEGPSGDCGYVYSLTPLAAPEWSLTRAYGFTNDVAGCGPKFRRSHRRGRRTLRDGVCLRALF